ncbi:MAG: glycosyltransferase family 2 protein [Bacteroidales bacterium]|nr:glycosyltransferase family 2 protein [Bacteroidales bacterium]
MNWSTFIDYFDTILFVIIALQVFYIFIFASANLIRRTDDYPTAKKQKSFLILYPAYKEDDVIMDAVHSMLSQNYPSAHYEIVVISDQMKPHTLKQLRDLHVTVLEVNFENSSKAKAMQFAIHTLPTDKYDYVVVMDADNQVEENFLTQFNNCFAAGSQAIQAHRKAANVDSDIALLDAVSEEINNSVFRRGHERLGFSSALIGSGMAFEYIWFAENIDKLITAGEDKELEALLLKDHIYIDFMDNVPVYDKKTRKEEQFGKQRRRWMAAQVGSMIHTLPQLPAALISGNFDYADKIIQWIMMPRVLLIAFTGFITLLMTLFQWTISLKWWGVFILLIVSLSFAIPDELVTKRFPKALMKAPFLALKMFLNLFRLKGVNKKFIHAAENEK